MSDKKISELESLTEVKDEDMFVLVDSSDPLETKKGSASLLKEYFGSIESYDDAENFPAGGLESKLYLSTSSNKLYRWNVNENQYVELSIKDSSIVQNPTGVSFEASSSFGNIPGSRWIFSGLNEGSFLESFVIEYEVSWDCAGQLESISHYELDYSPDSGLTWFNIANNIQEHLLDIVYVTPEDPGTSSICGKKKLSLAVAIKTERDIEGNILNQQVVLPSNIDSFYCFTTGNFETMPECSYISQDSLTELGGHIYSGYARTAGPSSRRLEFRVRALNQFGSASDYGYTNEGDLDYSELFPPTGISFAPSPFAPGRILFSPSLDSVGVLYEVQYKFKYPSLSDGGSAFPDEWTNINRLSGNYSNLVVAEQITGYSTGTIWFNSSTTLAFPTSFWNIRIRAVDQVKNIVSNWGYMYEEVLHYESLDAFPEVGDTYPVYVADDTEKSYRWQGSGYEEVTSVTPPLGISDIENLQEELDNKLGIDSVIDGGGY